MISEGSRTQMRHRRVGSIAQLRAAVTITMALALCSPAHGGEADLDRFRANIDALVGQLGASSNGVIRWAGSDPYEIRREGNALVAVITNSRLLFRDKQLGHLTVDRIEIRQIGQKEDGKLIELALSLPKLATLSEADGTETKIELGDAKASALIEADSGRGRDTTLNIASTRIEQPKTGAWVSTGPVSMASKLIADANGGWTGPVEFVANEIQYFVPQGPLGGSIHRIAFNGTSAGPKLDELNKLREAIERLQNDDSRPPEARATALIETLPTLSVPFSTIRGKIALDGLIIRDVSGGALVSLAEAESAAELVGLDTGTASIRLSIRHDGLDIAPSVADKIKVPHRVAVDLGIADLSTQAISKVLQAVATMAAEDDASEDQNQVRKLQATQEILGAMAMLNPTFHVYDISVDTQEVGIDLTAEAKGSPLAPKGYTAAGDLTVRGFDEISKLNPGIPFAEYLPVLKQLGIEEKAPDGTPRLDFHVASAPSKWITINGNDVGDWFDGSEVHKDRPRLLKPSDPPLQGEDVKNVQRALARVKIAVDQGGVYNPATAAAVARFQKQNGMNVNGVVDAAVRRGLGVVEGAP
jgi:Putative peptidoglycan binding domain